MNARETVMALDRSQVFGNVAEKYARAGLVVIPCGGEDGKRPLVRWRRPPSPETLDKWRKRFAGDNVGIATEPSHLTVVDVDDPGLVDTMIRECGETPLVAATPRGGTHLYYRHGGEMSRNGVVPGVDVKAAGGFIVAPPSTRPDTGQAYRWIHGDVEELTRLPAIKPGSLPLVRFTRPVNDTGKVQEGRRNNALFKRLMREALTCDGEGELMFRALAWNETLCDPPLTEEEVARGVHSVWRYKTEDSLWVGQSSRVTVTQEDSEAFGADLGALVLWVKLRLAHGGRPDPFAISPEAMYRAQVIPGWGPKRYREKRQHLLDMGRLVQIHEGGARRRDPHLYAWPEKGGRNCPQYN